MEQNLAVLAAVRFQKCVSLGRRLMSARILDHFKWVSTWGLVVEKGSILDVLSVWILDLFLHVSTWGLGFGEGSILDVRILDGSQN